MILFPKRLLWTAALAVSLPAWTGCADEAGFGETTSISGTVVDPAEVPIFGIQVAVLYDVRISAPMPGTAEAPVLGAPYPNPVSGELQAGELRIPVAVDSDTTGTLEVLGSFGGVPGTVATLHSGSLAANQTFQWDARDRFANLVPNGLYVVRLTVPANPPQGSTPLVQEARVLVNRSDNTLLALGGGFNAQSDPSGEYLIDDIAVEARFTATSGSGQVLGTGTVRNLIRLLFWDPSGEYRTLVLPPESILAGSSVAKVTVLDPVLPAPRPPADHGGLP